MAVVNVKLISDLATGTAVIGSALLMENAGTFEKTTIEDIVEFKPMGAFVEGQRAPGSAIDLAVSATTWTAIGFGSSYINTDSMWASAAVFNSPQRWYMASGCIRVTDLSNTAGDINFRIYDEDSNVYAAWYFKKPENITEFYCNLVAKPFTATAFKDFSLEIYCSEACTVPIDAGIDTFLALHRLGRVS